MGDLPEIAGTPGDQPPPLEDRTHRLEALSNLVVAIYALANEKVQFHGQQCQMLAAFCGQAVANARKWFAVPRDAQLRIDLESSSLYLAQMNNDLQEIKDLITNISQYDKVNALMEQFKIKSYISAHCVALANCCSIDRYSWKEELRKAAAADRRLLVDTVTAAGSDDIDKIMRRLQSYLRSSPRESDDYGVAVLTLREVQRKADMRLLPVLELGGEARQIIGAPLVAKGTMAELHRGIWLDDPNTSVVLKYFALPSGFSVTVKQVKKFHMEVDMVRKIQHRNIIDLYGVYYGEPMGNEECRYDGSRIYLVFPYMKNGNIADYLTNNPEADRMSLMLDVARGIAHLHAQDPPMVHNALQPSNVLVDDAGRAIVANFGLTKAIESLFQNYTLEPALSGLCRWMAPELSGEGKYGMPADAYAWAMTALQVLSGLQPFYPMKQPRQVAIAVGMGERPKREQYPADMFTKLQWELLEDCWKQDPAERLKMSEVVKRIQEMRLELVGA